MKWKERGMVSMINKDYFKYLIKQNKKYLILIYVIGIIIPFWMFNEHTPTLCTTGVLSLVYGLGLSCIVPIYLFSFLQKKKSNILYFSLPIKKESKNEFYSSIKSTLRKTGKKCTIKLKSL